MGFIYVFTNAINIRCIYKQNNLTVGLNTTMDRDCLIYEEVLMHKMEQIPALFPKGRGVFLLHYFTLFHHDSSLINSAEIYSWKHLGYIFQLQLNKP